MRRYTDSYKVDVRRIEALRAVAEKARVLVEAIFPIEDYDAEWTDLVDALDKLSAAEEYEYE